MCTRFITEIFLPCLLSCIFSSFSESQVCYPPNEPHGGDYRPRQANYNPGEFIEYWCFPEYLAEDRHARSTCQDNGLWSTTGSPFCDGPPMRPNIAEVRHKQKTLGDEAILRDGDFNTCYESPYGSGITLIGVLRKMFSIAVVKIYVLKEIRYRLEVFVSHGEIGMNQRSCQLQDVTLRQNGWLEYRCPQDTMGDKVFVKDWLRDEHFLHLCELVVININDTSCGPPSENIANGYLRYGRTSANLVCSNDFKPSFDQSIVCQNARWQISGIFCRKDDSQNENSVVIIVSVILAVLSLVIIISMAVYFLWRRKKNSIPTSRIASTSRTRSYIPSPKRYTGQPKRVISTVSKTVAENEEEEHQYSQVRYSGFLGRVILPTRITTGSDSD